jgi:hypothetical protein
MTAVDTQGNKRDFSWWVTAILAPLGILGGPIAIAEMFKGLIKWKGPIGAWEEVHSNA